MARKRVQLTWLPAPLDESRIRDLLAVLGKAGLAVEAAPWNPDLAKVGWAETAEPIAADPPDLWLVVGTAADLADPDLRLGLSLARITIRSKGARPVPMAVASLDTAIAADGLPPLLRDAQLLAPPLATWGARTVALTHTKARPTVADDFRLSLIAHSALGLWFEIGPATPAQWQGAIFGIDAGDITHQGVGPSGVLPERCTLEYPSQGIQVEVDGRPFTCWAIQNVLDGTTSHFIRVLGKPTRILFGELPAGDAADLAVLQLT